MPDQLSPSTHETPHEVSPENKPFIIELKQTNRMRNGSFTPAATLYLTEHFRTSGLLLSLPPEDLKNLLFVLSFVSPNGNCQVFIHQLASAMRISAFKARLRMGRLLRFTWQEQPLVLETKTESGLIAYSPHPHLVAYEHEQQPVPEAAEPPSFKAAPREAVIAHSRQQYAKSRAQVEMIWHYQTVGIYRKNQSHLKKFSYLRNLRCPCN